MRGNHPGSLSLFRGMQSRLNDAIDQAGRQWHERSQQPQPPPHRPGLTANHLVPAESAKPVEGSGHASAVSALVQLKAAVPAPRVLPLVHDHGRLITAWTQARGDKRQRRQLHCIQPSVAGAVGVPPAAALSLPNCLLAWQGVIIQKNPTICRKESSRAQSARR